MRLIALTQGKFAEVDDEDFDYLNQWKWYATNRKTTWYAARKPKDRVFYMHREVLSLSDSKKQVDHVDSNGLNNQKINLRGCNQTQNNGNNRKRSDNKSGFKGVHHHSVYNSWIAQIRFLGKKTHIGSFQNKKEAVLAYNERAKEIFGEFARIN